jgi:hypothetical protein
METETLIAIMALVFFFVMGFVIGFSVTSTHYEEMLGEIKKLLLDSLPITIPDMRKELEEMVDVETARLWIGKPKDDGTWTDMERMTKKDWKNHLADLDDHAIISFYTQYIKQQEEQNGRKDD